MSFALGTKVPVRALFETPTVVALAAVVESQDAEIRVPLEAGHRPDRVPLSPAQQRMWFLNRFDTDTAAYNVPMAIRLSGDLDVDALQAAVSDLVTRHESLRTYYPETADGPIQVIVPAVDVTPDLSPVWVAESEIIDAVTAVGATTFDVTGEVPLAAKLFQVGDTDYVLAFVVHHISADGSSMGPLTRDLMQAYMARSEGGVPTWEMLPVQYADYAVWQRTVLGSEDDPESIASKQVGYWKRALAGLPDQLDLPTDRPRPAVQSFHGARVDFTVDADLHRRLTDLGRQTNTTLFMVLHTAFAVFLARVSASDDIAIGTPIAGRAERELDDLIGMFANTLVFRTRVDGQASFAELLEQARETDLGAFANADVPFERLVEVLNPARSTARHPLFQVGLSFQNLAQSSLELPGLTISGIDADMAISQFDLHLIVTDRYDATDEPPASPASSPMRPICSTSRPWKASPSDSPGSSTRWSPTRRCRSATCRCSTRSRRPGYSKRGTTARTRSTVRPHSWICSTSRCDATRLPQRWCSMPARLPTANSTLASTGSPGN